jgi:signal transduction histidine kinase
MAQSILEGTLSLERLLTTVLQYSRPLRLELHSKDLASFLRKLILFVQADPSFPPSVNIVQHIPRTPLLLPIDETCLRSALLNLIFNALQAMPQGGVLTLALFQQDRWANIEVNDTGVGIEEADWPHLFSPFFTKKRHGNGLGLAEARKIVEAHFGTLQLQRSAPGHGSTFHIMLPTKR